MIAFTNKENIQNSDLKNLTGFDFDNNLSTLKRDCERIKSSMRKQTPSQVRKSKNSTRRELKKNSNFNIDLNNINNLAKGFKKKNSKLELITPHQMMKDSINYSSAKPK